MKETNKIYLLLALLMILTMLAGCSSGNNADTNTGTSSGSISVTEAPPPAEEKRTDLVVQIGGEPTSLDMSENTTLLAVSVAGQSNIHDLLVDVKDGVLVGHLAESWVWNDDYTQITFTLRDGILFSDGSPITPEDVVYSFKTTQEKGIKMSSTYAYIKDIQAQGDNQVVISLSMPYTPLVSNMTADGFCVFSKAAMENDPNWATTPTVVSGAYYVSEWKTGAYILLSANDHYWAGAPSIKTIKILFMPDENNSLVALEAGDIDVMTGVSFSLGGTSVQYLQGNSDISLLQYQSANYNYMVLNQTKPEFQDENVRKAIDYAINRDEIVASALDGLGTPVLLPTIPGMGGYIAGYEATKQDVAKAKEYMAASAYPNGFDFTLNCPNATWLKVGQVVQSQLKEIGIKVTLKETDIGTQVTDNAANNYEAFVWSFGNSTGDVAGITLIYVPDGAKNYSRFSDPTINDAFVRSNGLTGEERNAALKEAYDAIADQTHYIPLYFPTAFQAAVAGLKFDTSSLTSNGLPIFFNMAWK